MGGILHMLRGTLVFVFLKIWCVIFLKPEVVLFLVLLLLAQEEEEEEERRRAVQCRRS